MHPPKASLQEAEESDAGPVILGEIFELRTAIPFLELVIFPEAAVYPVLNSWIDSPANHLPKLEIGVLAPNIILQPGPLLDHALELARDEFRQLTPLCRPYWMSRELLSHAADEASDVAINSTNHHNTKDGILQVRWRFKVLPIVLGNWGGAQKRIKVNKILNIQFSLTSISLRSSKGLSLLIFRQVLNSFSPLLLLARVDSDIPKDLVDGSPLGLPGGEGLPVFAWPLSAIFGLVT